MPLNQSMDKENVILSGKNNDILKFACKMDGTRKKLLSEVTQSQKDEHGIYSLLSGY